MAVDYGQVFVERLIIHDVPLAPEAVVLSEGECDLDDTLRNYFSERFRASLQHGFDIEPDPESGSSAPTIIRAILDRSSTLVDGSHLLARHLHSIQKPPVSPGLLVVGVVTRGGTQRAVALLKLERQNGMRAEQAANRAGQMTFAVDLIKSLILTDTIRIFKAALLIPGVGTQLIGKASDHQAGHNVADLAHFFLANFLGCRLTIAPETATRQFFEATQSFINDRVSDPVTKTNYDLALLAELNSQRPTIEPRQFATAYLQLADRQPYLRHLRAQGVNADGIVKSLSLISSVIRRITYDFDSGIRVLAGPDVFANPDIVSIDAVDGGRTRLSIVDALKRIR